MEILSEIKRKFAEIGYGKALELESMPSEYSAWVIKYDDWYGVGIPHTDEDLCIVEKFSNVKLWSRVLNVGNKEVPMLLLTSTVEELRREFASVCAQFADPGEKGEERKRILNDPLSWWSNWRSLLGNSIQDKEVYSILGEMIVYEKLLFLGQNPKWSALQNATHDLELTGSSYEVKSTISRYSSEVTINSQYQLMNNNAHNLNLVFCRFEPSESGISIDDMYYRLVSKGVGSDELNSALIKLGLEHGSSIRQRKYKLLDMRKYIVDESFPAITSRSFINSKIPDSIVHISYTVDLNGLHFESWME
ncbi:hypothetical protein J45TS6_08260 [Paenibacillus sp. J45TS6]|uniref:PD-(D/E)XK motif protein n=1 Tax=Paenibacillus sp. J45TS6 TaxID=2807196 RepID=UPI001B29B6E0|nr:PD-(D/E)XK motif protein [Paenibacillus sp. J45TS6]GIP42367.1 hypothetical protein J45TS6_08260 [Paenibacillus sp. J45TS6]